MPDTGCWFHKDESEKVLSGINTKMPRLIIVKVLKIKNKEKILKAVQGKRAVNFHICKGFSTETEPMGYIERERDRIGNLL